MKENIKIQSSYIPKKQLDVNEWFEVYKVGSRVAKFDKENNAPALNSQYDFSRLFRPTEKLNFIDKIKSIILADLW